mgnify:CR=1 FL=1
MVTKNSGYVAEPETIPRFQSSTSKIAPPQKEAENVKTSIRKPDDIRLGFSLDRPSGVRLVLLKLFGKASSKNPDRSGTNPRSIVGYYDTLSKAMIAYDKSQFPPVSGNYANNVETPVSDYNPTTTATATAKKTGKKGGNRKSRKIGRAHV